MKALVIKPVLWNDNGYIHPAGAHHASKSWPAYFGYGHEEWNNNPKRIWQKSYRIFHTENPDPPKTSAIDAFAEEGNLGILMISSNQGKQYAVGIAANVLKNSEDDRIAIARDLKLRGDWKQAWAISSMIGTHSYSSKEEFFNNHWEGNSGYTWFLWRCPDRLYHWFNKPILIHPSELGLNSKRFVQEYSSYQKIDPYMVKKWLIKKTPEVNKDIIHWLEDGPFDESMLPLDNRSKNQTNRRRPKSTHQLLTHGRNAPPSYAYSYWVEGERTAHPQHAELQSSFMEYLRSQSISIIEENVDYMDVCYVDSEKEVLAEVKPTQKGKEIKTRYAIRAAIGQLMEYRYYKRPHAQLEIVLDKKPTPKEIQFLKALDIRLAYRTGKRWSHIKI